jgi:serine/threonine-protein kinase
VHRDVKPGNILLCRDGSVKLTDFGIAKSVSAPTLDLTVPGTFIGTAKYLAPEQVQGAPVDARADVYALGIVLYEAIAGRTPFDGPNDASIALARLHERPTPIRELCPGISAELAAAIDRAVQREPGDRWPSMRGFRIALVAAARNPMTRDATAVQAAPSRAPQPNASARFSTSERRWLIPALFVVIAGVSLAIAGVLIGRSETGTELVRRAREAVGASAVTSDQTTTAPATGAAIAATIAGVEAFDPEGDGGGEHDNEARNVFDGNPGTKWTSEGYNARTFGTKRGVGLVVELTDTASLAALTADASNAGWAASVYVSDTPANRLEGWGQPAATRRALNGRAEFDLGGRRGRYVLLWITDLGEGTPSRAEIAEITVTAAQ